MTVAPSRDLVVRELAVEAAAYVVGLVVLLFVSALPAGQLASLLIGLAIFVVVYLILYWLVIRRPASILQARPWRYWIPIGVAIAAAGVWGGIPRTATAPDVTSYAVAIPLLIAGHFLSNLWWASAAPDRA